MAQDKLLVINKALLKVGLPLAANLEDCDWNAKLVYENVTEQLLRGFAWGFAQKFEKLTNGTASPTHGYRYSYALPAGCLRVIDVRQENDSGAPKARYVLTGRALFTNVSPCYLRYVDKVLEPANWPPDFTDAVASHIAVEIAALSGEKIGLVPQLVQLANIALAEAQMNDARENTERVPLNDSLYAMRSGGGQ